MEVVGHHHRHNHHHHHHHYHHSPTHPPLTRPPTHPSTRTYAPTHPAHPHPPHPHSHANHPTRPPTDSHSYSPFPFPFPSPLTPTHTRPSLHPLSHTTTNVCGAQGWGKERAGARHVVSLQTRVPPPVRIATHTSSPAAIISITFTIATHRPVPTRTHPQRYLHGPTPRHTRVPNATSIAPHP